MRLVFISMVLLLTIVTTVDKNVKADLMDYFKILVVGRQMVCLWWLKARLKKFDKYSMTVFAEVMQEL